MLINEPGYKDFIKILNQHSVEYLIVGGYAVIAHGYIRGTWDFDLWVNPKRENSVRLIKAIEEYGYDVEKVRGVDLNGKSPIKLVGEGYKIDILHNLWGVEGSFEDAYKRSKAFGEGQYGARVIAVKDLIDSKLKAMRKQDLADVEKLMAIQKHKMELGLREEEKGKQKKDKPKGRGMGM